MDKVSLKKVLKITAFKDLTKINEAQSKALLNARLNNFNLGLS